MNYTKTFSYTIRNLYYINQLKLKIKITLKLKYYFFKPKFRIKKVFRKIIVSIKNYGRQLAICLQIQHTAA